MIISKLNASAQLELSLYFERIDDDIRILPIHLGLIMALIYHHRGKDFTSCFHASRRKLMKFSGIRAICTYHKYLSELVEYGYVEYMPSWHPTQASCFKFIQGRK